MNIAEFKDIHKGKRCVIVCNGSSLDRTDLRFLRGEIVIGLNRGYLKDGVDPNYIVTVDEKVIEQFGTGILEYGVPVFSGNELNGYNVVHLKWSPDIPTFSYDLTKPIWQGHTVTYVAMQLAYWMGFSAVYTIGQDHYTDYSAATKTNGDYIQDGEDNNHFSVPGGYYPKGTKWNGQSKKANETAYILAREAFEENGRILANASVFTRLEETVIPRVDYYDTFYKPV